MDIAVSIARAYLELSGYFALTELPVRAVEPVSSRPSATGGGESMGGKTFGESWQAVARLGRDAAAAIGASDL